MFSGSTRDRGEGRYIRRSVFLKSLTLKGFKSFAALLPFAGVKPGPARASFFRDAQLPRRGGDSIRASALK